MRERANQKKKIYSKTMTHGFTVKPWHKALCSQEVSRIRSRCCRCCLTVGVKSERKKKRYTNTIQLELVTGQGDEQMAKYWDAQISFQSVPNIYGKLRLNYFNYCSIYLTKTCKIKAGSWVSLCANPADLQNSKLKTLSRTLLSVWNWFDSSLCVTRKLYC